MHPKGKVNEQEGGCLHGREGATPYPHTLAGWVRCPRADWLHKIHALQLPRSWHAGAKGSPPSAPVSDHAVRQHQQGPVGTPRGRRRCPRLRVHPLPELRFHTDVPLLKVLKASRDFVKGSILTTDFNEASNFSSRSTKGRLPPCAEHLPRLPPRSPHT